MTPEEDGTRRKLIRLWSSANHAQVKGCCLQVLQLLTGREVVRTHRHWRLMMKRPFWSAQEALRQMEGELPTQYPSERIRLDAMYLHFPQSAPGETFRASSSPDASTALATDQGMHDDLVPPPVAI